MTKCTACLKEMDYEQYDANDMICDGCISDGSGSYLCEWHANGFRSGSLVFDSLLIPPCSDSGCVYFHG